MKLYFKEFFRLFVIIFDGLNCYLIQFALASPMFVRLNFNSQQTDYKQSNNQMSGSQIQQQPQKSNASFQKHQTSNRNKIQQLHRILDHEIRIFEKPNVNLNINVQNYSSGVSAFDQIETKLKNLQSKLGSLNFRDVLPKTQRKSSLKNNKKQSQVSLLKSSDKKSPQTNLFRCESETPNKILKPMRVGSENLFQNQFIRFKKSNKNKSKNKVTKKPILKSNNKKLQQRLNYSKIQPRKNSSSVISLNPFQISSKKRSVQKTYLQNGKVMRSRIRRLQQQIDQQKQKNIKLVRKVSQLKVYQRQYNKLRQIFVQRQQLVATKLKNSK